MAVTVRGIALDQISLPTGRRAVVDEIIAGGANGLITSVLVAIMALVFDQAPLLGLVLGVLMVLNLVIAGFSVTIIPLILDRIGKDPATSATIFITTGVPGFFRFLWLAQHVLWDRAAFVSLAGPASHFESRSVVLATNGSILIRAGLDPVKAVVPSNDLGITDRFSTQRYLHRAGRKWSTPYNPIGFESLVPGPASISTILPR